MLNIILVKSTVLGLHLAIFYPVKLFSVFTYEKSLFMQNQLQTIFFKSLLNFKEMFALRKFGRFVWYSLKQ